MTSATEFENVGNQPPYSRINARWDAPDDELDNDNSSARLFERSRIKALAGTAWDQGGQKGYTHNPYPVPVPPCHGRTSVFAALVCRDQNTFAEFREHPFPRDYRLQQLVPESFTSSEVWHRWWVGPAICLCPK